MAAVFLAFALIFTGCQKKTTQAPQAAQSSEKITKIGLVTDVGGVNDQSFNQSAWEGLQRLRTETGANVSYIESKDESNYTPNIDTFVDQKSDLIWGVGFMLGDAFAQAGKDYPNQQFAIVDYAYAASDVPNKNVTGIVFSAEECSFLVGYIAGKVTKTGKVGHVNGISSPTMETFAVGYYAGVLTANPNAQIMGQYSGSFGDPAAGKNIANQYFAAGADIVYHAAGGTGAGVIEAAREQNKWAIGVDMDQNYIAPNNVLTSALKRVDNALYDVSDSLRKGTYVPGSTLLYNLKNNGVGYATTGNHIPADVIRDVEAIKAKIISGEQKVPATAAEINALFPGKYNLPAVN
ncbi:BMP family lipoprotein [Treponema primitia]|uniref:BMP family lipoprotein n=1 Tax=Treponema primitia TaxID=88058 RepID=UPI0005A0F0EA|nr:BMP family ABC transporter substrate-binding protein [Treponema primitia]